MADKYKPLTGNAQSRIQQYVERRASERVDESRLSELETQLEQEERRNLRLSRELQEEVALRARAERTLGDLQEDFDTVQLKLTELENKADERKRRAAGVRKSRKRAGVSGNVPDSVQPVDGSPPSQSDSAAVTPDISSDASEKRPATGERSSRRRGSVK